MRIDHYVLRLDSRSHTMAVLLRGDVQRLPEHRGPGGDLPRIHRRHGAMWVSWGLKLIYWALGRSDPRTTYVPASGLSKSGSGRTLAETRRCCKKLPRSSSHPTAA